MFFYNLFKISLILFSLYLLTFYSWSFTALRAAGRTPATPWLYFPVMLLGQEILFTCKGAKRMAKKGRKNGNFIKQKTSKK